MTNNRTAQGSWVYRELPPPAPREWPILFTGPMVRAILEGRKTQTRRILSARNCSTQARKFGLHDLGKAWVDPGVTEPRYCAGQYLHAPLKDPEDDRTDRIWCKYNVGDSFWVKETHQLINQSRTVPGRPFQEEPTEWGDYFVPYYRATDPDPEGVKVDSDDDRATGWRPSIFMHRWSSRLDLEILNIRVERAQSLTPTDAMAEGLMEKSNGIYTAYSLLGKQWHPNPVLAFAEDWNVINKEPGNRWEDNPWLWIFNFPQKGKTWASKQS